MFKIFLIALSLSFLQLINCLNLECSNNPSDWCNNIENAKTCDVVEQCWKNVWSQKIYFNQIASNDLVNLTLYYETLCPDCREFISGQLLKAFNSVRDIMNLTLVPYGNAKETYRSETKLWQFNCQHGSDECWGNLLHSCLIYYYPKTEEHYPFIACMESNNEDDIRTAAIKCGDQFNVTMTDLNKCMTSRLGNNLQHQNAVKTEQLNPPHKYVPWITINGIHTEDIQQKAEENLVNLICQTYKGFKKPEACEQKRIKKRCLN